MDFCFFGFLHIFCYEGAPSMIKSQVTNYARIFKLHEARFMVNLTILLALSTNLSCNRENVAEVSFDRKREKAQLHGIKENKTRY